MIILREHAGVTYTLEWWTGSAIDGTIFYSQGYVVIMQLQGAQLSEAEHDIKRRITASQKNCDFAQLYGRIV